MSQSTTEITFKVVTSNLLKTMQNELETPTHETLSQMLSLGYKVLYNFDKGIGTASYRGIEVKIQIGSENFYFDVSNYSKCCIPETLQALTKLVHLAQDSH